MQDKQFVKVKTHSSTHQGCLHRHIVQPKEKEMFTFVLFMAAKGPSINDVMHQGVKHFVMMCDEGGGWGVENVTSHNRFTT